MSTTLECQSCMATVFMSGEAKDWPPVCKKCPKNYKWRALSETEMKSVVKPNSEPITQVPVVIEKVIPQPVNRLTNANAREYLIDVLNALGQIGLNHPMPPAVRRELISRGWGMLSDKEERIDRSKEGKRKPGCSGDPNYLPDQPAYLRCGLCGCSVVYSDRAPGEKYLSNGPLQYWKPKPIKAVSKTGHERFCNIACSKQDAIEEARGWPIGRVEQHPLCCSYCGRPLPSALKTMMLKSFCKSACEKEYREAEFHYSPVNDKHCLNCYKPLEISHGNTDHKSEGSEEGAFQDVYATSA
jgi:hypothetical protein